MAERVSVFGGSLQTGVRPEGGFRVFVTLPVGGPVIRVLVADDQALVRGGFRSILETQPDIDVVGEAEDGRDAVRQAATSAPTSY